MEVGGTQPEVTDAHAPHDYRHFDHSANMSHADIVEKTSSRAKDIDKECDNKWNWLARTFESVPFSTWCVKLEEPGKAYCMDF